MLYFNSKRCKGVVFLFISFEGNEGVGKSTQVNLLQEYLLGLGYEVLVTCEPGGTQLGEKISQIVKFYDGGEPLDALTETLLFYASRRHLISHKIEPFLQKGGVVISDRFYDSTYVYQGYAKGMSLEVLQRFNELVVGNLKPSLTFLLNSDKDTLTRAKRQTAFQEHKKDRFESLGQDFNNRVSKGFLELAKREPKRFVLIDASLSIEEVFQQVKKVFNEFKK